MHTERFTEEWQLLDTIPPSVSTAEQNSGWNAVAGFDRIVVIIQTGAITSGGTIDADIEIGTTSSGGTTATMTNKSITQLTSADANKVVVIEMRPEEFIQSNVNYGYVQLELTCATQNCLVGAQIWGHAMYQPAVTTTIDEIVD